MARDRADGILPLVAAALAALFGLELLRAFLPLCTFYLHTTRGLHPLATAAAALAFLSAGALAPAAARRLGPARALAFAGAALAAARVALQLTPAPAPRLALAALGAAAFVLLLPLQRLAWRGEPAVTQLALGWAAGAALDLGLRLALGTLDLAWQPGPWPLLVVAPAALLLFLALRGSAAPAAPAVLAPGFALLGCWLFLELALFQNPAALAARTGTTLAAAGARLAAGKALGAVAAALTLAGGRARRLPRGALAAALLAAILAVDAGGRSAGVAAVAGAALSILLLTELLRDGARQDRRPLGGARQTLLAAAPGALLLTFLFLLYARFDVRLPLPAGWLEPAALLPLLASRSAWRIRETAPTAGQGAARAAAVAVALLAAAVPWLRPVPVRRLPPATAPVAVRVATYNLHQGFDVGGRLDPEALAATIERTGAEIVGLQEVSRGWVVTGSLDLLDWLARRLRMEARFGPTAGSQWGNGLLSRYPVLASRNLALPPDTLTLRRGALDVTVAVANTRLRLLVTHFHHRGGDQPVRDLQARRLLELWGGSRRTLLLGDLNSTPDSPAIAAFRARGLLSASWLLAPGARTTHRLRAPREIDYVWATADLRLDDARILESPASDHLPLAVDVVLPAAAGR